MLTIPSRLIFPLLRPLNPPKTFSLGSISHLQASSMAADEGSNEQTVSLTEWQGWGTDSPLPAMVVEVVKELKDSEREMGTEMKFGGLGSKLKGNLRDIEDKKKKSVYSSFPDSEKKLQFFTANQVACRLLGAKGYLCQKCWLPNEDCMCSKIIPCSLWSGIKFWLYMHPKDFLRQNNTGKLLWQLFGIKSASMCVFGILEQEEIMWDFFKNSGKETIFFIYPNVNSSPKSVQDIKFHSPIMNDKIEKPLNFVLLDGTWSNSTAMYRRLKEKWVSIWGEEELPCISLSALGTSVMHKLRPQPAWDRTCTAAAAAGVLSELHSNPEFNKLNLDKNSDAIENSLDVLLNALTERRVRMGRSVMRKEKRYNNCLLE
ncbi:hypothetical protein LUZ60_012666 [Juncus effusus]|nr:hypothetical protein LUZ60_012666 [Juncus effusus]